MLRRAEELKILRQSLYGKNIQPKTKKKKCITFGFLGVKDMHSIPTCTGKLSANGSIPCHESACQ
jgi:hypothetical protein